MSDQTEPITGEQQEVSSSSGLLLSVDPLPGTEGYKMSAGDDATDVSGGDSDTQDVSDSDGSDASDEEDSEDDSLDVSDSDESDTEADDDGVDTLDVRDGEDTTDSE